MGKGAAKKEITLCVATTDAVDARKQVCSACFDDLKRERGKMKGRRQPQKHMNKLAQLGEYDIEG